jgi:tetratricopeptide (TPR) repeat protein
MNSSLSSAARWLPSAVVMLIVAASLFWLTRQQSGQYVDAETLYRATLERSPASWFVHNNLAALESRRSPPDFGDAVAHQQAAIRLNPNEGELHMNLGLIWQRAARFEDAVAEHREALRLDPSLPKGHYHLGVALEGAGRIAEAIDEFGAYVGRTPDHAEAREHLVDLLVLLGNQSYAAGQFDAAVVAYRDALALRPAASAAEIQNNLGLAFVGLGRIADAAAAFAEAVRLKPDFAGARANLVKAQALLRKGGGGEW